MNELFTLPRFLPEKTLARLLVQHGPLVERLAGLVSESATSQARHHMLLTGPTGSGKTHIATYTSYRLRESKKLQGRLLVAQLPEEPAGITTLADLLRSTLEALANGYPELGLGDPVAGLAGEDEEGAQRAAEALLRGASAGATVLIVIENLHRLFGALGPLGQRSLRAFLQQDPCAALLATAPAPFPEIAERGAPFFGFFRIEPLAPLTPDTFAELAARAARMRKAARLDRAALAALHHLSGGNARLAVLAGSRGEAGPEAMLAALADQAHWQAALLAGLSPQQAKIFDLLAAMGFAIPVKEIARRCLATEQTVSSQLRDLKGRGLVAVTRTGRNSFYEASDPFLRISVELLRRGPERVARQLGFLRAWFTPDKKSAAALARLAGAPPEAWARGAAALARTQTDREALGAALVRGLGNLRGPLVTAEARRLWVEAWQKALAGETTALELLEAGLAEEGGPESTGLLAVPMELRMLLDSGK